MSLFNIINFEDSKSKDLQNIITQKVNLLAKKNNISVEQDAIKELLQLQLRYMPYSGFPGKTIRFLESIILNKKDKQIIDRKTIIKLFCNETGLPDFMIDHSIKINTHEIAEFFKRNIFGQDLAVEIVLNLLMSVKTGLNRNGKPIASLLFVGSTGIGKTEMSKVLAEFMFNNRQKILRFDMSEYSTHESVLRLTGIGFFSEGILTSKVRQEPFSVVLFDELEKAHYSFFDLLLQILGEGRLTDSKGKVTDFCSTIIIMTSNIGARDFQKNPIGFIEKDIKNDAKNHFMKEVQDFFRPELFNRIDQVIPFLPLDKETVKNIVDREIRLISNREGIKYRDTTFDITDKALNYLANKGYEPFYGARQMQRTLRDELLIPLSKKLNSFEINTKLNINIDFTNSLEINVKGLNVYNKKELGKEDFYKTNISHLRRSLQRLEEGEFFIKLLSNLDILEHKKKKLKEDFWKNNLDSENYTNYTRLKSEFYTLFNQAKELEVSLFLQNFNFSKPMIDNLEKEYNSYSDYIEDFKINLYKLIKPEHKVCTIGIYGQEPFLHDLTDYYKSLAEELDFETKLKYIWHKENYGYNKTDKLKADHKDDILTGIELECRGSYPYLYFKDESGKHCFKKNQFEEDKDAIEYVIVVENCKVWDFKTPKNVHRKIFFDEMKSRRMFDNRTFKDSIYNWAFNQEIPYKNLLEEILDIIFSEKFLSILLNGEDEE
ncbi:MAG: AAA family ATPase [Candidatus Sericytochromatia bacterium]